MMKKYILGLILLMMFACEKEEITPSANFIINEGEGNTFFVGEQISIRKTGAGEFFTVYTGDQGHAYEAAGATGFTTNSDGVLFYTYASAGLFEITMIASYYTNDGELVSDVQSQNVTIIDTANTINKIQMDLRISPTAPDEIRQSGISLTVEGFPNENNIIPLELYHHSRYGYQFVSELPLRPQIFPKIPSATYEISVPGGQTIQFDPSLSGTNIPNVPHYDFTNRYVPVEYSVTADDGNERSYKVVPLVVPEFENLLIQDNPPATVRLHPVENTQFYATLPYEKGADVTNAVVEYTLFSPDVEVIYQDDAFPSGSNLNLENINTLNLSYTQDAVDPPASIESEILMKGIAIPEFVSYQIDTLSPEPVLIEDGNPRIYEIVFDLPKKTYVPEFELNIPGTEVLVNNIPQVSGTTSQNFLQSSTKNYILTNKIELDSIGPIDLREYFFVQTIYRVRVE